ncbi:MAG TPA: SURF1 family protein [Chloroflexota bacterium]|nr:SURF1 family protein [Chloroflexota bacterium]
MWLLRALMGRWRWMALAALFSAAVTVRLGFWQLDRLAQRRAVNFQLASRLVAPPLRLPGPLSDAPPAGDALRESEFRRAVLRGFWDFTKERPLTNQFWEGQLGVDVIAPFILETGRQAVLVDRGWLPAAESDAARWERYRPPQGPGLVPIEVRGYVRLDPPRSGWEELRREARADGVALLPFHVTEEPPLSTIGVTRDQPLPYKRIPVASIGEGVHAIAAAQWFLISGIIVVGLVIYVSQRERPGAALAGLRRAPERALRPRSAADAAPPAPGAR